MFKLITAPTVEPVLVSELKSQLRITSSAQDTMLGVLLKAARQNVEDYLRYSIITATWELYLDCFPKSGEEIWIQKSPVTEIVSIIYKDTSNVSQTWAAANYVLDANAKPGRVYENYNCQYPDTLKILNAVTVKFKAGYASAAEVPEVIKQAILMQAATLYENPSDEVTGTQVNKIDKDSEWLLKPHRAMRF